MKRRYEMFDRVGVTKLNDIKSNNTKYYKGQTIWNIIFGPHAFHQKTGQFVRPGRVRVCDDDLQDVVFT